MPTRPTGPSSKLRDSSGFVRIGRLQKWLVSHWCPFQRTLNTVPKKGMRKYCRRKCLSLKLTASIGNETELSWCPKAPCALRRTSKQGVPTSKGNGLRHLKALRGSCECGFKGLPIRMRWKPILSLTWRGSKYRFTWPAGTRGLPHPQASRGSRECGLARSKPDPVDPERSGLVHCHGPKPKRFRGPTTLQLGIHL